MPRLTKTVVDEAVYPEEKGPKGYHVVWDEELKGFGLRCNPVGSKTFVCKYRHQGRTRLMKVGRYPKLTVKQARTLARGYLLEALQGRDPAAERKRQRSRGVTLADLWDRYLKDYATPHYKPRTLKEAQGAWSRYLESPLGRVRLEEISRDSVARLQARVFAESGRYAANDAVKRLRRLLRQAAAWGLIPQGRNPAKGVKLYREKLRERFLSADEHRRLHRALEQFEAEGGDRDATAAVRLLMWTGCRAREILGMAWEEVDLESRRVRRETKTGRRTILLAESAASEVAKLRERNGDSPFVFPGRNRAKARNDYVKRSWARILELAEIEDLRLHDLRHNAATVARRLGISLKEVGDYLGHKRAATTEFYAHGDEAVQRDVAQRVEAEIQRYAVERADS